MKKVKGIILAGGHGSRLYPLTYAVSKQLLPVYDKPMIYYPLSVLMESGIKDILIISTESDLPKFKRLLKDGSKLGINIKYETQKKPRGIAESFVIAESFLGDSDMCLILGDNIFYSQNISYYLKKGINNLKNQYSSIFSAEVDNPQDFGVIELDKYNKVVRISEKPKIAKTNLAVVGLYFYTNDVIKISKKLKPSKRNELEITDINNIFLSQDKLKIIRFQKDTSWIDTGTYDSLLKASSFFCHLENKTGLKYACIEEIALRLKYISKENFLEIAESMNKSNYGKYLFKILNFESK